MLIYTATKSEFIKHIDDNQIEIKIDEQFRRVKGHASPTSEVASWMNSLSYMRTILDEEDIPDTAGVAIEYNIPQTSKRIDFILTGRNEDRQESLVIIELKQWEKVQATKKDAIVETYVGGRVREVNHPSYQAWSYASLLEDFNEAVQKEDIMIRPCAYLHNCRLENVINSEFYKEHTLKAPAFLRDDTGALKRFIKQYVKYGDDKDIMFRIDNGRVRPSKSLSDHLSSLLKGNKEFVLIDDQKLVYEGALDLVSQAESGKKQVFIIEGGPGTGKSVIAINLLVELTSREKLVHYVTKNSAPREVYQSVLAGTITKTRISNLFKGSGAYTETVKNAFDALVVDEAHRLNAKSGMFRNKGENQIKEIINSAKCSIFFIDENQIVSIHDIGEKQSIINFAKEVGAEVTEGSLSSQFRCNGSDGYLSWLDNILQVRPTANERLDGNEYDFKVLANPKELRERITSANVSKNKARIVAGYCWDWVSKKNTKEFDIIFEEFNFKMKWNLSDHGMTWILKDSVDQIGCIHTCQGLELDYVGVIIGPDLIVRDGKILTDISKRSKNDSTIKGFKKYFKEDKEAAQKLADIIIKNTYRTLMTRGSKGCYVWSSDPETNEYFKSNISAVLEIVEQPATSNLIPFPIVPAERCMPFENSVPLFDFKIAAGEFSSFQNTEDFTWVELPDHYSIREGMFIAQVHGESMNKRIPNGSWCLFRANPAGSREGKIVLVQHRNIQDQDNGGYFTVKRYHSEKVAVEGEDWKHSRIVLSPESNMEGYGDIVLEEDEAMELRVVGEFVGVVG